MLHHDVTLNDEHPPLPKVLAALPVLVTHPVVPANGGWSGNDEESYGAHFIAAQLAAGKLRSVTFASRLVPLAETAGVAFALFAVASELSGPLAGVLAGMLWLASPLVLGLGHLDGTDIPFALGVALSSWALLRWLRLRDTRALVWVGLALAAAAETQVTGLLVVGSGLAVIMGAEWRSGFLRTLRQAALVGLIVWGDRGGGMDVDSGEHAGEFRQRPGGQPGAVTPQPVAGPVAAECVHARVADDDLKRRAGGRIPVQGRPHVPPQGRQHG